MGEGGGGAEFYTLWIIRYGVFYFPRFINEYV